MGSFCQWHCFLQSFRGPAQIYPAGFVLTRQRPEGAGKQSPDKIVQAEMRTYASTWADEGSAVIRTTAPVCGASTTWPPPM